MGRVQVRVNETDKNEEYRYLVVLVMEHAPTRYTVYASKSQAEAFRIRDAVAETIRVLERVEPVL